MNTDLIGTIVHFYDTPESDPQAAILAGFVTDNIVNLGLISHDGRLTPTASVNFVVDGEALPNSRYCLLRSDPIADWARMRGMAQ